MKKYNDIKKTVLILLTLLGMAIISKGDNWIQKASCPVMRKTSFSFSIGLKGYTGCGRDSSGNLTSSFWEYDQSTNSWTQKADLGGFPREGPIGFSIGNKGYAGLGFNANHSGALQDFYEYDTATNAWAQKAFFQGLGCSYSVSFTIGNYGYVCTGTSGTADYQELWQYDPSTDSWNQKTGISGVGRQQAMGFSIGTKGYVCGGFDLNSSTILNDFWEYNSLTDSWTQKANTPGHPRCDAAAFSIVDKGYLGIGDTAGGCVKDFWQYDTTLNQWHQKTSFPGIARDEATFFTIGNKGYIGIGGESGIYYDFWEYAPDSSSGINEISNAIKTSVYPNPFTDNATLTIEGNSQNSTLNIFNISGQKEKSIYVKGRKNVVIEREKLKGGIYFYELIQDNSNAFSTGRIVIE